MNLSLEEIIEMIKNNLLRRTLKMDNILEVINLKKSLQIGQIIKKVLA